MSPVRAKVIDGGKVVIPASMRRAIGVEPGDTVLVDLADGEVRIRSLRQAIARAQATVRRRVPADVSLADELIADRRREASGD